MPVIEGGQVLRGGQDFGGVLGGQVLYGGQELEPEQGGRTQPDSEAVEMSVGPFRYSGAPPNGWYNGVADKGAIAVDVTTGTHYVNTGTKTATVWTADAPSGGGSGPLTVVRHAANATLNTTTDAGAVHLVTANGVTLTLPALADGLVYDVIDGSASGNASIAPQGADSVRLANFTRAAGVAIQNDGAPNTHIAVTGVAGFGWVTNGDNGFDHWG